MRDEELLSLLRRAADAVGAAVDGQHRLGPSGLRPTQYRADLLADAAALEVLHAGGLRVVSEESGATGEGELTCVLDPIDGSTNFDRGIPFYSVSMCVLDEGVPRCALVRNLATAMSYEAVRGGGATRDGAAIRVSSATTVATSIVAFSGLPARHGGWAQFRALGAASLELCAVADGSLDAYAVVGSSRLSPWDYLGALLVLQEAGGTIRDAGGLELVEASSARRRPVGAATEALCDAIIEFVSTQ